MAATRRRVERTDPLRRGALKATATSFPLVAVALLGAAGPARSQGTDRYVFTTYGMEEGLSHGTVEAIVQDSTGFLWIGTHGGVDRFDGRGFRAFRHRSDDTTSLASNYVLAVARAPRGRLWVGTEDGGLDLLDPLTGVARHFGLEALGPWSTDAEFGAPTRGGRTVWKIAAADDGSLVVFTDAGFAWFDPVTERYGSLSDSTAPLATALCGTSGRGVFVGFADGTIRQLTSVRPDAGSTRPVDGAVLATLPGRVDALACSAPGSLLLAATRGGGIWQLELDDGNPASLGTLPGAGEGGYRAVDLLRMPDGAVWIATTDGVWRIGKGSRVAERVVGAGAGRSIPHSDVRSLFLDARGVLWIGTWNGLASLHPLQATMHRVLVGPQGGAGLRGDAVIAIEQDTRGRVWVGTDGGGVQRIEGDWKSGDVRAVSPPGLGPWAGGVVFGLESDGKGGIWIAAYQDGVLHLRADGTISPVAALDDSGNSVRATVYSVFRDREGDVWAGSLDLGLLRYDSERMVFAPHLKGKDRARLGSEFVWPITEDPGGRLWVGAVNGGLASLGLGRTSIVLRAAGPEGPSSNRILCVLVDSGGTVWVGTEGGGLNRLDPKTGAFRVYGVEDGLPHQNVEAVVEDGRGYLWVSTSEGLARFDRTSEEFLTFTDVAGLAGNRFYANAAYRTAEGELLFGGPAGITILDPAAIERRETPPTAALTAFRIQGREMPIARAMAPGGLDLRPKENFFAFEFAAMDFVDPSQNRYRYRLEGLDPGWVDAGTDPVANYTSVPPARYVFRVAARNSEGIWNQDALAIPVRVRAPFYRTAWFRTLVLLVVLSLAWGMYSYRRRELRARERLRLQARESLRSEIAGELHDDIGANLSTIVQKAWLVGSAAVLDERGRTHLEDMGRLARESVDKVRETVWVVNTRYDTVSDLVKKMQDTVDTMLRGQVTHSLKKVVEQPDLVLSMETRRNIYLMFKESLHNVLKHASASTVGIELTVRGDELRFRVSDDGVGFDAAVVTDGSGQDLLRRRAALCNGSVHVTSAPGKGTTIEVRASLS